MLLGIVFGPLPGGLLVDLIMGTYVRWWRWWYTPLAVALAGIGGLGWLLANNGYRDPDHEHLFASVVGDALFIYVPFLVFIPTVMNAVGVGLRRVFSERTWG